MRFLIKMAFWLALAFVVLPHTPLANLTGGNDVQPGNRPSNNPDITRDSTKDESQEKVGPFEALFAAQKTLADLNDFCARNSSVCETGKAMFSSLGLQAKDGARIAYEYLNAQPGDKPAASAISSTIEELQAKMPETLKNTDSISIPIPTSRQSAAGKTDALHTGTVKHEN